MVRAKTLPSTSSPARNMAALNTPTKAERGRPKKYWAASPNPVVPPVISPLGSTNRATASAYSVFPASTSSSFQAAFPSFSLVKASFITLLPSSTVIKQKGTGRRGPSPYRISCSVTGLFSIKARSPFYPSYHTRKTSKWQAAPPLQNSPGRGMIKGKQKKEAFSMSIIPTPAQAMEWVRRYNQEEFHLHHAKTVGWVLGCLGARSAPPGPGGTGAGRL